MTAIHRIAILAATLIGGAALAAEPMTMPPTTTPPMSTMPPATTAKAVEKLSDAQIASLVVVMNQGEIDAAKYMVGKTTNADVKKFAQQVLDDHTALLASVQAWQKKNGTPTTGTSQTQTDTANGAKQEMTDLAKLSGSAADRSYVDAAVSDHQMCVDLFDHSLIEQADDADLGKLLRDARPTVAGHLETAKHLQSTLGLQPTPVGTNTYPPAAGK